MNKVVALYFICPVFGVCFLLYFSAFVMSLGKLSEFVCFVGSFETAWSSGLAVSYSPAARGGSVQSKLYRISRCLLTWSWGQAISLEKENDFSLSVPLIF